jgi:cysteine-rich repeat protein
MKSSLYGPHRTSLRALLSLCVSIILGVAGPAAGDIVDCRVVFSVESTVTLTGLGWKVDYTAASGEFLGAENYPECENLVPGAVAAFRDFDSQRYLHGGFVTDTGAKMPAEVAACIFRAPAPPLPSSLLVSVRDASDLALDSLQPLPTLKISDVACAPVDGSTTTTTSSTTTTVPGTDQSSDWSVLFRLQGASKSVEGMMFTVDYSQAQGDFLGEGSQVSCVKKAATALFAGHDADGKQRLTLGFVALEGLAAPQDLVSCTFRSASARFPLVSDFRIAIDDATGIDGQPAAIELQVVLAPSCVTPECQSTCGNGVVNPGEACDDGNLSNNDACLNSCVAARCGDGFTRSGVEACDDGNSSNTDGCLNSCAVADCGDGFARAGVEECDDGNMLDGDGCSSDCRVAPRCSDPNADGRVLAGDALRILQRAVGLDVECPDWTCDVNGDGKVVASDSFTALLASVGLPVQFACSQPGSLVLRLVSATKLAGLQVDVDFDSAKADLVGSGAAVQCVGLVAGATFAFNAKPSRTLSVSVISLEDFAGPRSIVRCKLVPTGIVKPSGFAAAVVDAQTSTGATVPGLVLKAIPY